VDLTASILGIIGLLLVGSVISAMMARARRACAWTSFIVTAVAMVWLIMLAMERLLSPSAAAPVSLLHLPILNSDFAIGIDGLSAIFLALIGTLGLLSALYSIGYITDRHYERESLVRYYPFFFFFLIGMIGVTVAWDLFLFLICWEVMTLASYVLVVFEGANRVSLRAGFKYFVITHIGTACLIAAFLVLRHWGGSFGFDRARQALGAIEESRPLLIHAVLLLMFIGFGTKSAIFPLGDWLPDAHPAAPSPISCLLSGVMIKLGVYGLLRMFVAIAPPAHAITIWGGIIAFFGALSLFVGTMEALTQHDSKRLLAFHSMGQMGYIFLGIGIGMAFLRVSPAISAVGFIGGIFHLINHACFKGLLFLNAGSALIRAGTRELDHLGGLAHRMPITAVTAVIASFAIAGIPPLNGFASKWLLYQTSLFAGLELPIYLLFGIVALFISAVTLASFVKFLGTIYFGQPSANVTARIARGEIREVPATMVWPQAVLAAGCVILGIFPAFAMGAAHRAIVAMRPHLFPAFGLLFSSPPGIQLNLGEGVVGSFNPVLFLAVFAGCTLIPIMIYRSSRAGVRQVEPWVCGEIHRPEEIRVPAIGFYLTFRTLVAPVVGRARATGFYPRWPRPRAAWLRGLRRAFDFDFIYRSIVSALMKSFEWVSRSHVGYPQVYVLWMAAGLVIAAVLLYTLP
jgi:hydrogenase-4 component B